MHTILMLSVWDSYFFSPSTAPSLRSVPQSMLPFSDSNAFLFFRPVAFEFPGNSLTAFFHVSAWRDFKI
jgi:hypothetical protein